MDLDAAATQFLLRTVVVNSPGIAPDVDAEDVWIVIISSDLERVASVAADVAFTHKLGPVTGDYQPFGQPH